ncbi:hydroxypyruvate isomerase family protein [Chitinophaga sp. XS-30]|uniref:hydroxypyruvate isomerase family protein n=1 Tax=Chitinophaga sp. XS-30 TaxID=2604421 RepID=UPI0011DE2925|nr:TIM barrel protein [Chitinophaga sp. XS-30]QEH40082.1 TIM barrel protein [Chitinophaga sp. XS-30]
MTTHHSRRDAIKKVATMALAGTALSSLTNRVAAHENAVGEKLKGRINHSVCAWCYNGIPLEELCKAAKDIGIQSIDLLGPDDFATAKKYDLTCAMVASNNKDWGITRGWNRLEHHDKLVEYFQHMIDETAKAGFTNLICFSGNRDGLDDQQGLENCASGLKKIMGYAEKKKVTLVMELLNSKVNHADYQCDHTAWGVELCKAIGSDQFKLLYDIYHMQIMEGDVIRTIRENQQYIAHYHTGGVPGRNEIDETQELFYPAIMQAVLDTGFKGFVAQEFVPKRPDKLGSLKQAVGICDI